MSNIRRTFTTHAPRAIPPSYYAWAVGTQLWQDEQGEMREADPRKGEIQGQFYYPDHRGWYAWSAKEGKGYPIIVRTLTAQERAAQTRKDKAAMAAEPAERPTIDRKAWKDE